MTGTVMAHVAVSYYLKKIELVLKKKCKKNVGHPLAWPVSYGNRHRWAEKEVVGWLAGGMDQWMAGIIVVAGVIVQLVTILKKLISIQKKK